MGREASWATVHRVAKSQDMTERLSTAQREVMGALYCESTKCHCIFYIQVVNPKLYESHSIFFKYHIRMGLKILRGKGLIHQKNLPPDP